MLLFSGHFYCLRFNRNADETMVLQSGYVTDLWNTTTTTRQFGMVSKDFQNKFL